MIHNPSDHPMREWPTHWRGDRRLMERLCEHGVGHPDPDDLNWRIWSTSPQAAGLAAIHGCDWCCEVAPGVWHRRHGLPSEGDKE